MTEPMRVGVSACLLGAPVRFDGGHCRAPFLELLARYVALVPVCPEYGLGLGSPRETLRLVREPDGLHLVAPRSGKDHTAPMRRWSEERARELPPLCGYVLKKDSPTCGLERVRVYGAGDQPTRDGRGIYAQALLEHDPGLPAEEEGRLNDPILRERFLVRVFARHRLRTLLAGAWRPRDVIAFQAREKLLLMAHDPAGQTAVGRIVARVGEGAGVAQEFGAAFERALSGRTTRSRHVNALQHMAGYFKRELDRADRAEIVESIAAYSAGEVPRTQPLALLRHHARRHGVTYLTSQSYLEPYPPSLRPTSAT